MAHLLSLLGALTWGAYLTSRVIADVTGLPGAQAIEQFERLLRDGLSAMFNGGTSVGKYVFIFLMSFLLWLMAYLGAWAIFRWRRVWWTVILCGAALMINIDAAPGPMTGYMIVYVLFALLLVVRTSLAFYEDEWRMSKVGYSPELVYGFLRAGLVISVAAILLAWAAPQALASRPVQEAWHKMSEPWRRFQDSSSRMFEDLNYRNPPAFITFARSMKFGGPVELTDLPVVDVEAPLGRYWRVIVFHEYTSDGWENTDSDIILIDAGDQQLAVPELESRREITQTFTLRQHLGPTGVIAAAGQPLRSNLPLRAVVSILSEPKPENESAETLPFPPAPGDPSILYSREGLEAGESYKVYSSLTRADDESLREAGTDYPHWVVPRYLQLPDSLPERVRGLAEQVTLGRDTAYDKAQAIERYLRDIPYNQQIDGPDPDQDGVDYFLFESREGYCDYYASAMVVMLRSVGVPARYARGYSQNQREEGVFHVLEKDGHAWPEVFFPGYGWVEFEPTAGEPVLVRPRSADDARNAGGRDEPRLDGDPGIEIRDPFDPEIFGPFPEPEPEGFLQRIGRWGGFLLAVAAFVLVGIALLLVRRQRHIEGLSVVERVYGDLVHWVRRLLRLSPLAHQTPHEYAGGVAWVVPKGRRAIEQITDLYVQERFGGKEIAGEDAESAWGQVWPMLWKRWLRSRGERLRSFRFGLLRSPVPGAVWREMDGSQE
jgi:hypothetical protein